VISATLDELVDEDTRSVVIAGWASFHFLFAEFVIGSGLFVAIRGTKLVVLLVDSVCAAGQC
jgi:hypothetical protein